MNNDIKLVKQLLEDRRFVTAKYFGAQIGVGGAKRWAALLKEIKDTGGALSVSTIVNKTLRQSVVHLKEDANIVNEFVNGGIVALRKSNRHYDAVEAIRNAENKSLSAVAIAEKLELSTETVLSYLRKLRAAGAVEKVGGSRHTEYCLPENIDAAKRDLEKRKAQAVSVKHKKTVRLLGASAEKNAREIAASFKTLLVSATEIMESRKQKHSAVRGHIKRAIELGLIVRLGAGSNVEYCLTENLAEAKQSRKAVADERKAAAKLKKKEARRAKKRKRNSTRTVPLVDFEARAKADAAEIERVALEAGKAISKAEVIKALGISAPRYHAAKPLIRNVEFSRSSRNVALLTHYGTSVAIGEGRSDKAERRRAGGCGEMVWRTADQFDFSEAKAARIW